MKEPVDPRRRDESHSGKESDRELGQRLWDQRQDRPLNYQLDRQQQQANFSTWLLTLPFRILLLPFKLFSSGKPPEIVYPDAEFPEFVRECIQKGTTDPKQIAENWMEAHPEDWTPPTFNQPFNRRIEAIQRLLAQNA